MQRTQVEFVSNDTRLKGYLYLPDSARGPLPTVIATSGFASVQEHNQHLGQVLTDGDMALLMYDHRTIGRSDGEPRGDINPFTEIDDMRTAISFAESFDEVDADRIGLWGTSFSGGHVLIVTSIDKRVKCVVSEVPFVSGRRTLRQALTHEQLEDLRVELADDRRARLEGKVPRSVKITTNDPDELAAFPEPRNYYHLVLSEPGKASTTWRNEVTLRSLDHLFEYDVESFMSGISPAPLLMITSRVDKTAPADLASEMFERAYEPKKHMVTPGDHFAVYLKDEDLVVAAEAARDWFVEHLFDAQPVPLPVA